MCNVAAGTPLTAPPPCPVGRVAAARGTAPRSPPARPMPTRPLLLRTRGCLRASLPHNRASGRQALGVELRRLRQRASGRQPSFVSCACQKCTSPPPPPPPPQPLPPRRPSKKQKTAVERSPRRKRLN
eukprot:scaffold38414_cov60-Phaeocystis_antarctica.AAC.1